MKILRLIALSLVILCTTDATANFTSSSRITYTQLNDSTYRVFLKCTIGCHGQPEPPTVPMCIYNSCTNQTATVTLQKWTGPINGGSNGDIIRTRCDETNTCTGAATSIAGWREWWYYYDAILPQQCATWRFSVVFGNRQVVNLDNPGDIYTEASLNNLVAPDNNGVDFMIPPMYIVAGGNPTSLNRGAIDADGDSIVTRCIQPLTAISCANTTTNVPYKSTSPAYNATTNPIQCNNTFTMNQQSGTFKFTPANGSGGYLTFRTDEYRNNVLIGSYVHDAFVFVLAGLNFPSPTLTPITSSISGASWSNDLLTACIGTPVQMCFYYKSANPSSILSASDNLGQQFPGATITYSGSGDSIRGCINWTPTVNDAGKHKYVYTTVKDIQCSSWLVHLHSNNAFRVYVTPGIKVSKDTTVCPGEKAQLNASGGFGNFTWSVLSGTPASLSCAACSSPQASPAVASSYLAVSNNTICPTNPNYRDTVNVKLHTAAVNKPSVVVTAVPGNVIPLPTSVTFTATVTNCNSIAYQWKRNGSNIPGATSSTWASSTLTTGDIISCRVICNDTCPQPRDTTSNAVQMTLLSVNSPVNSGTPRVVVYPNPSSGSFTLYAEDVQHTSTTARVVIVNTLGQEVFKTTVPIVNNTIRKEMNLHSLPPSLYTVGLYVDDYVLRQHLVLTD